MLHLLATPWGERKLGVWCEKCQLATKATQDIIVSTERATVGRFCVTWCYECGDNNAPRRVTIPKE